MVAIVVFSSPGETLYRGQPTQLAVGNTLQVAQQLTGRLQVAPELIHPQASYPRAYADLLVRAQREQQAQVAPAIQPLSAASRTTDTWFLGAPLWFGELPRPVVTAVLQARAHLKVVYPFITHEGGGLGKSIEQLRTLLPDAQIKPGLPIRGSRADRAACAVTHWLNQYYSTTQHLS